MDKKYFKKYFRTKTLTSVASRDTITFLPARRTLTLEEFKYAFESWRQTLAIAGSAFLQIFH
jgi:GGDEF domain-containing protein